jgi:cytochrome c2
MKTLKVISLVSFGIIAMSCSNQSKKNQMTENLEHPLDGKTLLQDKCLVCHGNGTSHDDIIAPPMKGVKNHYLTEGMTEREFVEDIKNWINNPTEENSKMPGAINKFGVMPKQEFNPDEVEAIATYVFNNEMTKPTWFDQHMNEKHGEKNIVIEGLDLNEGKKWKANPETTVGINNMIEIMSKLKDNPTIEDYQKLGLELEKEKKSILNQCTMDGVAHDNLHKYLMPLIRRINGLKEVETIKRAEKITNYINMHLTAYFDYFE